VQRFADARDLRYIDLGQASGHELLGELGVEAQAARELADVARAEPGIAEECSQRLGCRAGGQRDEIVRRFNPADVEPAYRAAVENYFERLSRDARPAAKIGLQCPGRPRGT